MRERGGNARQGPSEPLLERRRMQIKPWHWLLPLGLVLLVNVLFGSAPARGNQASSTAISSPR
jgi:hypothetical protein